VTDHATDDDALASVEAMASAYIPGAVVAAAVELGVFDHLATPRTASEVAEAVGGDPDGTGRLLRALVALGVARREPGGRFVAPDARALRADDPGGLGATFLHHRRHLAPLFAQLAPALRGRRALHRGWEFAGEGAAESAYEELARHPDELAVFLRAMDRDSRGVGAAIAASEDLGACERLLDLGGGGGVVARELLAAAPELVVQSVDLAPACEYAKARARVHGLEDRHEVTVGDLRELPEAALPADVVLLSSVLADFPPAQRERVFAQAVTRLRPGGRLLVSETLLDPSRTGPGRAALLSLMTFAAFGGDQLTLEDVRGLLSEHALELIAHHSRGERGRDLIVARSLQ